MHDLESSLECFLRPQDVFAERRDRSERDPGEDLTPDRGTHSVKIDEQAKLVMVERPVLLPVCDSSNAPFGRRARISNTVLVGEYVGVVARQHTAADASNHRIAIQLRHEVRQPLIVCGQCILA